MTRDQQLPVFDAGSWLKTARLAVAAIVVLSAVTVAVSLIVGPPRQYLNWHLKHLNGESLWALLAALTAPLLGGCCLVVFRWNWFARTAAKRETPDVVPSSRRGVGVVGAARRQHDHARVGHEVRLDRESYRAVRADGLSRPRHDLRRSRRHSFFPCSATATLRSTG